VAVHVLCTHYILSMLRTKHAHADLDNADLPGKDVNRGDCAPFAAPAFHVANVQEGGKALGLGARAEEEECEDRVLRSCAPVHRR
jgi:hypothetical protein